MEIETKYIWAILIFGIALGITIVTILDWGFGVKKETYLKGVTDLRDCLRITNQENPISLDYDLLFCESTLRGDLMIKDYVQKQEKEN